MSLQNSSNKVFATVDIGVITENQVRMIKRGNEPFKDHWAFLGGRIDGTDLDIESAAHRKLEEETHLSGLELTYVKTIGNNKRDPLGFCLTNVFVARLDKIPKGVRAGDDAIDYDWFDLEHLPEMAFDHREILNGIMKE